MSKAAYGIGGLAIGALIGGIVGRATAAPPVKPKFREIVERYSVEATWMGRTFDLSPEFIAQTVTGDVLWAWLEPGRGAWAITKMWEKPEGVSFEIARLCWAPLRIFRMGALVAEFPEVLEVEKAFVGYWSTTELP